MKRYYSCLFFSAILGLVSCSDDEGSSSSYKFKEQDAQGKINKVAFAYADGYADIDESGLRVTLTLAQDEEGCSMWLPEVDNVFFTVDNATGLTKLSFKNFEGHTVTLFEDDETMNWIATEGAVEILTITDTEVTGRLDARYGKNTFINGSFTVPVCGAN